MPSSAVDNIIEESSLPGTVCPTATWRIPKCPFSIECPSAPLAEIRSDVERASNSPRGAHEVGGVLFGIQEPGRVRIVAYRTLDCEHAMGRGFVLSATDEERLAQLISSPATDPKLNSLQALGWYHSHISSRIYLSELDLQVHARHFSAPCQIALVIRPSSEGFVRAAFFFREASGEMRTESGLEEFTLESPVAQNEMCQAPAPEIKRSMRPGTAVPKTEAERQPFCPRCRSQHIRRSRRTGPIERIRGLLGFYPYRCHECLSRSFIKTSRLWERVRTTRTRKRPEETMRSRVRTRREVMLWGGGILGFLAILAYLIRDTGPGPSQP